MKTKAKLFALTGSGIKNKGLDGDVPTIMHLEELKKSTELIRIGDESGFKPEELSSLFEPYINNDQTSLNIVLCMHGDVKDNDHYLTTKGRDFVKSELFLKELVEATKGHPLKILALSCFGANLHNHLDLLPAGSMLMTLSNKDQGTLPQDYFASSITKLIHEKFAKDDFKIEHLFEAYLFAQKFTNNIPVIGIRHLDSSEALSMNDLAKKYFSNPEQQTFKFSNFIENLVNTNVVSKEQLYMTINKVKLKEGDSTHLICKDDMLSLIIKHWENGTIEELIQAQEDNYYYPRSLSNFKLNMSEFDKNIKPVPIEFQNWGNVTLEHICYLHKYLTEKNIFESELQKEYLKLRKLDEMNIGESIRFTELTQLPENKLCGDYREFQAMFYISSKTSSILGFEKNNFKLTFDKNEYNNECDWVQHINFENEINNITPQSSVCMGAAFDLWLQEHSDL